MKTLDDILRELFQEPCYTTNNGLRRRGLELRRQVENSVQVAGALARLLAKVSGEENRVFTAFSMGAAAGYELGTEHANSLTKSGAGPR